MKRSKKQKLTFSDLEAMQQFSRIPCGKQAFTLGTAHSAMRARNALDTERGRRWWVTVCFDGCGRAIFHLTTSAPSSKKNAALNRGRPDNPQLLAPLRTPEQRARRARKRTRTRQNRERNAALALGTWQDDGGALHPGELED